MHLFAYGTLLIPDIWHLAAGRGCLSEEAVLRGHLIRRVREADFPGILEAGPDAEVPGRVFLDLDPDTIARLDAYESDFYERRQVTVQVAERELRAAAYVVPEARAAILSDEEWSLDWFREHAFTDYYRRLKGLA